MSAHASKLLHHLRRLTEPTASDAALMARWREQRDEDAFAALVARHGPMVLGVCRRILGDVPDAEDVFQAVFLVLARKPAALRCPDAVPSFLYGVALRLARKSQGAARRQQAKTLPLAGELMDRQPQALDMLSGRELLNVLDEEIARLPQGYRLPLLLCLLQDRSLDEAAQILGWRPGSVRGRLARGRARLRERLARRGLSLPAGVLAVLTPAMLPRGLQAGCLSALTAPPSPAVTGLVGAPVAPLKLKALSLALILAAVGVGACLPFLTPPTPQTPSAAAASSTSAQAGGAPPTDRYGDALPPGASARLGTIRQRFDTEALAWSADGRTIVTCNRNRSIRWWDARTGKIVKSRDWPGVAWRRVHISPDAKILAAEEMTGLLTIWDTATGKCLHTLDGYRWMGDYPFAFSTDSSLLAVANNDETRGILHVIDLATGRRRSVGEHMAAGSLAVSPDKKRLYCFGFDRTVRCWDVAAGKETWKMKGWPSAFTLSPDGRSVAVALCNQQPAALRFLDAATGRARGPDRPIPHAGYVYDLRYSPQGDTLVLDITDSRHWVLRPVIWDVAKDRERCRLPIYHGHFSPDGKRMAGWDDCVLQCWEVRTGKPLYPDTTRQGHTLKPDFITYSPDGKLLASSSITGDVRLWEVETRRVQHIFGPFAGWAEPGAALHPSTPKEPEYLLFSPDCKRLIVADTQGKVGIWDVTTRQWLRHFQIRAGRHEDAPRLLALQLDGDGETLSAVTEPMASPLPPSISVVHRSHWCVSTGKRRGPVTEITNTPFQCLSPGGRVYVWRPTSPSFDLDYQVPLKVPRACSPGSRTRQPLTFSPDGSLIAAHLEQEVPKGDRTVKIVAGIGVWESATGALLARLPSGYFGFLAFSHDNRLLALAGPDDIRIWDVARRKEVYRRSVAGHLLGTFGSPLCFSPDGKTLATSLEDTTVTLWDLSACKHESAAKASLSAQQQETLWSDLGSLDAARAYAAADELATRPRQTIPLLRDRLRPAAPLPPETLKRLIADLDSGDYTEREAATRRLAEQGRLAEAALREALAGQPSLEMRRRIEGLLAQQERLGPERLRALRSVRILEQAATAEARELLEALARGATSTRLTMAARAALRRLR